ncbi:MAG: alcohol dehydrogenase catalytic domain-containing protein [Spirochaetes bacterium]|nr:alcohol dehydrogenase catalytic domain-containing protein [Spirochaetota bacterium]
MKAFYFDNDIKRIAFLQAASKLSRNAPFWPFSPVRYAEVPDPELPDPNWLRVRNIACGLCGSDIHFLYMDMATDSFPAGLPGIDRKYLGHELVGVVEEAGKGVRHLRPGDRVALRIDWPSCFQLEIEPKCPQCARGNYMLCQNIGKKKLPLRDTGGGFSPRMVMHRTQPFKIPPPLTDDQAILLEPLACAVHGVFAAMPRRGDTVLVVGCGTIGLLTIAAARALQPRSKIVALARYPFQAELAGNMGADEVVTGRQSQYARMADLTGASHWKGYFGNEILLGGFDIVYDTVGNDGSIRDGLRWVRGGGAMVIIGINFMPGRLDYTPVWHQEVRLTGINCHATETGGKTSFDIAASLMKSGRVKTDGMITHRFPMDRFRDAVAAFNAKGSAAAVKIVLEH